MEKKINERVKGCFCHGNFSELILKNAEFHLKFQWCGSLRTEAFREKVQQAVQPCWNPFLVGNQQKYRVVRTKFRCKVARNRFMIIQIQM